MSKESMENNENYSATFLKIKHVEDLRNDVEDKLLRIILETTDPYAVSVNDFRTSVGQAGLETVEVEYAYRFRNVHDISYATIPVEWLEDNVDYRKLALDSQCRQQCDPAKNEALETTRIELAELARLKAKYEKS